MKTPAELFESAKPAEKLNIPEAKKALIKEKRDELAAILAKAGKTQSSIAAATEKINQLQAVVSTPHGLGVSDATVAELVQAKAKLAIIESGVSVPADKLDALANELLAQFADCKNLIVSAMNPEGERLLSGITAVFEPFYRDSATARIAAQNTHSHQNFVWFLTYGMPDSSQRANELILADAQKMIDIFDLLLVGGNPFKSSSK